MHDTNPEDNKAPFEEAANWRDYGDILADTMGTC